MKSIGDISVKIDRSALFDGSEPNCSEFLDGMEEEGIMCESCEMFYNGEEIIDYDGIDYCEECYDQIVSE